MVLNRISRKEADSRLARLRRSVSMQVFTLGFESGVCRETRQAAEELAEVTNRLAVEVCDAYQAGDLLRKYRIDGAPALVCSSKGSSELRLYGAPTGFALPVLLDAIVTVGGGIEPKDSLAELLASLDPGGALKLDLILSRHDKESVEAAAALWRVASLAPWVVSSVRVIEDHPRWAAKLGPADPLPALCVDGSLSLTWPFSDEDVAKIVVSADPSDSQAE